MCLLSNMLAQVYQVEKNTLKMVMTMTQITFTNLILYDSC